METEVKLLKQEMRMVKEQNDKDHKLIMDEITGMKNAFMTYMKDVDDTKQDKDEFVFWRNTLVGGILVSILLMVVAIFLN